MAARRHAPRPTTDEVNGGGEAGVAPAVGAGGAAPLGVGDDAGFGEEVTVPPVAGAEVAADVAAGAGVAAGVPWPAFELPQPAPIAVATAASRSAASKTGRAACRPREQIRSAVERRSGRAGRWSMPPLYVASGRRARAASGERKAGFTASLSGTRLSAIIGYSRGRLAQLGRAPARQAGGRWFNSNVAHHPRTPCARRYRLCGCTRFALRPSCQAHLRFGPVP